MWIALWLALVLPGPAAPGRVQGTLAPALEPLRFLLGEWEAVDGRAGESGRAAFAVGLQGRVITRTSYAEYPASGERPAYRHDDFMIVYADADTAKADYYDNEGHVIRYVVTSPRAGQAVFVSAGPPAAPHYRLTYVMEADGSQRGTFEIAPPGSPGAYATYLAWTSRRVAPR